MSDATLSPSDSQELDNFGTAAAISGKTIVIGSDRTNINLTGAAYVFGH